MPQLTAFPEAAVDAMCSKLKSEGMTSEIRVVNHTQPIVTPASLKALGDVGFGSGRADPDAVRAVVITPLIPVALKGKSCVTRFIAPAEAESSHDVMVIEFSSPFRNPYSPRHIGTFARMSLGGAGATWYWIPLNMRGDQWYAGVPESISFIE